MNVRQKLSLAALCFTLPAMASAQAAPAAAEPAAAPAAAAAPAPAPAPAAAPAAPAVTITPYGFINLAAISSAGRFAASDYPGLVANEDQKAFIISARQTRFGWNIAAKDGGFTGATLGAKLEADFAVGFLPGSVAQGAVTQPTIACTDDGDPNTAPVCTATAAAVANPTFVTASNAWHAGILRLRYAFATATWDFKEMGKLQLLAGQTDGLVNQLHPDSLAYAAFPMFWQAGNIFRRSPQIRAQYDYKVMDMLSLQGQFALVSSADGETTGSGVDWGAGNKTGAPDVELRVAAMVKPMADVSATIGFGYHMNKRGYPDSTYLTDGETGDVTATVMGIDLDATITKYASLKAEWYKGQGTDDMYSGIVSNAVRDTNGAGTAGGFELLGTTGFWAQLSLKPVPEATILLGMGQASIDDENFAAKGTAVATTTTQREKNAIIHAGVIANAGKNWRFGVEFAKTTTTFYTTGETASTVFPTVKPEMSATQVSLSSRFTF